MKAKSDDAVTCRDADQGLLLLQGTSKQCPSCGMAIQKVCLLRSPFAQICLMRQLDGSAAKRAWWWCKQLQPCRRCLRAQTEGCNKVTCTCGAFFCWVRLRRRHRGSVMLSDVQLTEIVLLLVTDASFNRVKKLGPCSEARMLCCLMCLCLQTGNR